MKEMRGGVIAHRGFSDVGVDYGVDFLPDANRLLGDYLMCAYTLNGGVAAGHFGDDGVMVVGVQPSAVADLSAGFGVEGRVIEDDLALVTGLEFLRALAALDDSQDFAIFGAGLAV